MNSYNRPKLAVVLDETNDHVTGGGPHKGVSKWLDI